LCNVKNDADEIEVKKEKWENIRYSVDKQTQQLQEEVIGKFMQYPLRLAWAITIHKSQGLTFDKVVIDAGNAFVPGQVYVALSRCTSLKGIVLKSRLTAQGLQTDKFILDFSAQNATGESLEAELHQSKKTYQQTLLLSLFDITTIAKQFEELCKTVNDNATAFNTELLTWLKETENKITSLKTIADKFRTQLNKLFVADILPENDMQLLHRLSAASVYFIQKIDELIATLKQSPASTDSKQHAKAYNDLLREIFLLLAEKKHLMNCCEQHFTIDNYYQQKKSFIAPSFGANAYATASTKKNETPHPLLHKELRELRNKICEQKMCLYFL